MFRKQIVSNKNSLLFRPPAHIVSEAYYPTWWA